MNVWYRISTIFNQRRVLQIAGILTICVALITTLFLGAAAKAAPGVNEVIGFQARLLNSAGNVVPDGFYNVQFKIYQGGSGSATGNPDGTLAWTETYINDGGTNGIKVTNGYMSVYLGSKTPFGDSIDWNQDTLWLSMNIAGLAAGCTTFNTTPCAADGEMVPMKRLTSTPYALNAGRLNGITSDGFIQNSDSTQTANFNISGNGIATTLQGNTSVLAPVFDRATSGTLSIGSANATSIAVGSPTQNQSITIGTGTGNNNLTLGSLSGSSTTTIQGGSNGVTILTGNGFAVQNASRTGHSLLIDGYGNVDIALTPTTSFAIKNEGNTALFGVDSGSNYIYTNTNTLLHVKGTALIDKGLVIQGTGSYLSPAGYSYTTAINIPNYSVGDYGSLIALGLPSTSSATAMGIIVTDARTSNHYASIGVGSQDESELFGLSWHGSNSIGYLTNTANSLALQGNGLNLLTATNNGGQANVGIGNAASAGYALDVTGNTNTSGQYSIGGTTTLTNSALTFSGPSTASITSANGQSLNVDGKNGVAIQVNGTTKASFSNSNLQIGTGSGSGTPTLLALDRGSSAPTGILGSMYYDTTLGKVQCYEADGWGACSSAPDTFVSLIPEYSNAVLNGTGTGTMNTDICSDALDINNGTSAQPTVCDEDETYNYYNWTSPAGTAQTKSIFVTYKLPSNFKELVDGSTTLLGRTIGTNASVSYQMYRNSSDGLVACGTSETVSTGGTAWQSASVDPSSCEFEAGDSIVIKIDMTAANGANAYVSNLGFTFKNK